MTVNNLILRNDYVANGSQTVYAFQFDVIYEAGEIIPYSIQVVTTDLVGVETIKTQGTDYTVQLNSDRTGTITFATAPILNHKITLLSKIPNTQNTDYVKSGTDKFPAESHEKALDKLTLKLKELEERFNRVVSVPKSSQLTNIEFPISPASADQVVAINGAGNNLTTKNLIDVNLAPVTAFAKTLLDDTNASEARTTLEAQKNVITARGDLIRGSSSGAAERLGIGPLNAVFVSNGNDPLWVVQPVLDASNFINVPNPKNINDIIQIANIQTGAVATGTTAIPIDDTIPQNTEGTQFMSLAVTPTSATNILQIDVLLNISAAAGSYGCLALFQDSVANAIATSQFDLQAGYTSQAVLRYRMTAGTISTTTFKVRAGGNNATTYTFNGQSGGRLFGGTLVSSITITEIKA